jgi:hypothetical protein
LPSAEDAGNTFFRNVGAHISNYMMARLRSFFFILGLNLATTMDIHLYLDNLNSVAVVRKRTIPTERPLLVGEVSANLGGWRVLRGQRNEFPRLLISVF